MGCVCASEYFCVKGIEGLVTVECTYLDAWSTVEWSGCMTAGGGGGADCWAGTGYATEVKALFTFTARSVKDFEYKLKCSCYIVLLFSSFYSSKPENTRLLTLLDQRTSSCVQFEGTLPPFRLLPCHNQSPSWFL